MQYRREIDGLRAIAVLPVILFHAGFELFGGGFVGVDVFFVISGYLITSIILLEKDQGTFTLLRFYERRARRILPALLFVILSCIPFAVLWMKPSQLQDFSQSVIAVLFFVSNILFLQESGYFEAAADEKPLLHTWSLAVEEQYYLLFPLFILFFWRFKRQRMFYLVIAAAGISLILSEIGHRLHPSANFYLIHTRAWELLVGSLCAFWLFSRQQRGSNPLAFLGLAFILVSVFVYTEDTPFPSAYAMLPVAGTALVILFAKSDTIAARMLSLPPLVGLGLISYSAYLWHQPLFAFARIRSEFDPTSLLMLLLCLGALVLAFFSWWFVERPFRKKIERPLSLKPLIATYLACAMIFAFVEVSDRVFATVYEVIYKLPLNEDQQNLYYLVKNSAEVLDPSKMNDNGDCQFYSLELTHDYVERIDECYLRYGPAILVLGDSHARDLYQALTYNSQMPFLIGYAKGGCRPDGRTARCDRHYNQFLTYIKTHSEKVDRIIYHQAGKWLIEDQDGNRYSRKLFRKFFRQKDIPVYQPNSERIDIVTDYLIRLGRHTHTVWLGPRVEPNVDVWQFVEAGCSPGVSALQENLEETFITLDERLDEETSDIVEVDYKSQIEAVKFDVSQDLYDCGAVYWSNGDHWSDAGEKRFGSRLIDLLVAE